MTGSGTRSVQNLPGEEVATGWMLQRSQECKGGDGSGAPQALCGAQLGRLQGQREVQRLQRLVQPGKAPGEEQVQGGVAGVGCDARRGEGR